MGRERRSGLPELWALRPLSSPAHARAQASTVDFWTTEDSCPWGRLLSSSSQERLDQALPSISGLLVRFQEGMGSAW